MTAPTEDTPTPQGGLDKPEIATEPKDTKSLPPLWRVSYKKRSKVVGVYSQMPSYVHEYPNKVKWERIQ